MNVTLFCLPFAGGSKYSLHFLKKVLPKNITCHFLEYAGRGARIKEEFADSIAEIVEDLFSKMAPLLKTPYALYGHSMGAKVAYLLSQKIREAGGPQPLHLFVSGTDAPSAPARIKPRYLLPGEQFINNVKELGGFPEELLNSKELLDYFEPILRADFKVSETYQHQITQPLSIPLTVMVGDKEDMLEEDILQWQNETILPMNLYKFPGNHFFIFDHEAEIGKIIQSALSK